MSKIYLEVMAPVNGKTYEFAVDSCLIVEQIIRRVTGEIIKCEDGNIAFDQDETLIFVDGSPQPLARRLSLAQAGVSSGDVLVVI